MTQISRTPQGDPIEDIDRDSHKQCAHCKELKPLGDFLRRTGRRSGKASRRGACRACRNLRREAAPAAEPGGIAQAKRGARIGRVAAESAGRPTDPAADAPDAVPKRLSRRPLPQVPPKPEGPHESVLMPNGRGIVWMRGKTDKGRRWYQETDLETAVTLVREHAAVVVNRHTIRRIYSNRKFRQYILTRDRFTCHFCGEYGDTIDHLLPRAKGGHTTPLNCVCACNLCNQSKADRSIDDFMRFAD